MMGVGPNSFDTNKQTNKQTKFYQLLTYLLTSENLLKSVEFHYNFTPNSYFHNLYFLFLLLIIVYNFLNAIFLPH
jgi:hypothetical protein